MLNTFHAKPARAQRGMGLVELMVGITVGLIVSAGAAIVATQQITEHRRLMLEVQMQQDLRVAADLMQQEMRRAGYRGLPSNGVWEPERDAGVTPAKDAKPSPFALLTQTTPNSPTDIYYQYARTTNSAPNTTNVVAANEQFGFRLANNTLYIQLGVVGGQPNWQPITDPDLIVVDSFEPMIVEQEISLADLCDPSCVTNGNCPTQTVRRIDFVITAHAKSDSNIKRTVTFTERIRADDIDGVCP